MTNKIDRRKAYFLTIDTETANTLDDPIVYDIGGAIHDKQGKVYETFSFVIYETFVLCADLMETAYYADKIPMYREQLANGLRRMVSNRPSSKKGEASEKKRSIIFFLLNFLLPNTGIFFRSVFRYGILSRWQKVLLQHKKRISYGRVKTVFAVQMASQEQPPKFFQQVICCAIKNLAFICAVLCPQPIQDAFFHFAYGFFKAFFIFALNCGGRVYGFKRSFHL